MNNKHRCILCIIILFFAYSLSGCALFNNFEVNENQSQSQNQSQNQSQLNEPSEEKESIDDSESDNKKNDDTFSVNNVPDYSGSAYCLINNNVPCFPENEKNDTEFEMYTMLDEYKRCGQAYANICQNIMPTEERGEIGMIKPSGWHTVKYPGVVDGNYLYNRCHLIAYCLAGENANEMNLITGTRYMNTEGMLPFEEKVARYVERTNNHVLYRVNPIFDGDDLLAKGVHMEAYSVEDKGAGISFNVFCYNVQPHVVIDYATGDSYLDEEGKKIEEMYESSLDLPQQADSSSQTTMNQNDDFTQDLNTVTYIGNKNTRKFHKTGCSSAQQTKEKNRVYFHESREEITAMGYEPCKNCNP